ncbi:protein of unknown function [Zhouia amylolytica]|uniref:DUF4252 domain-containing protein n=2 Tax=Zhouia amylolytica TaxID=376730 RepID=W2UPL4_9FLAO|nr:DUF4252 domain-containing protein [Zhouia amylolytica]ETN95938.1 hypothetical protein P278_16600 [Zhouia amylolytica AD3]MCQ0111226.1 DUF4252 domain-containing protein [Zhouia amylolytica]SFS52798.1 protein of unknown function [Zhouia amylolytica]
MKKIALILVMAMLPLAGFSQSVFDKFEDANGVKTFVASKKAFELFSRIETNDPEAKEFMELTKNLTSLKVFATENPKVAAEMKATVDKYLSNSSLEELMRVKDDDTNVKFYIKAGKDDDHVSELLMFVNGIKDVNINGGKIETVLLTLTGDIDLNKISTLTSNMNLPSELNKAGQ